MDTIFAQATAPGRAGLSVIRISGPMSARILSEVAKDVPKARVAGLRKIMDPSGAVLDEALVLFFEGPHSFTGEDVVELHLHGSIAVVRAVLDLLGRFPKTRIAEPGEFTRRALENEKLDLTQVEGLADLIEAETEMQRKQALNVLSGYFGNLVEGWRGQLIRAAALLEVTIDFADEDVPVDVTPEVHDLLSSVMIDLAREIDGTKIAERVSSGFEVAIVGAPNAGKSTLLNALAGRDAAITSSTAGTTRDVIEVRMDLGGIPVTLLDTAGLRDGHDEIEVEGISRAIDRAVRADVRVFLTDNARNLPLIPLETDLVVRPKADLLADKKNAVSGKSGFGVSELVESIRLVLADRVATVGLATHARHRVAMMDAIDYLKKAAELLDFGSDHYDIVAAELRFAIRALEILIGRIGVENLLDEIFTSFCLGK